MGNIHFKIQKFIQISFFFVTFVLLTSKIKAEDKPSPLVFFEKLDFTSAYLSSKQCLKTDPNNPICLRIFFLTEPSLSSMEASLNSLGNDPESNEMYLLYSVAMEKAMAAKNIEYGLKWGEKIFETWRDRETSQKAIFFYAYFLSISEQSIKLGEVLNWLRLNAKSKSIQRKLDLLSKRH